MWHRRPPKDRYRIILRQSLGSWWHLQERRWCKWVTIGQWSDRFPHAYEDALEAKRKLEGL